MRVNALRLLTGRSYSDQIAASVGEDNIMRWIAAICVVSLLRVSAVLDVRAEQLFPVYGYARVLTVGQSVDAQVRQLRAANHEAPLRMMVDRQSARRST